MPPKGKRKRQGGSGAKAPPKKSRAPKRAAAAPPAAAAAAAQRPFGEPQVLVYEYTAAENETPRVIAETLQVSLEELVDINKQYYPGLRANARLKAGTVLEVPGTTHTAPAPVGASDQHIQGAGADVAAAATAAPAAKRRAHKRKEWKAGDRVEALYPPDGNYYEAIITAAKPETYCLEWTEADEESHIHKEVPREHVRKYRPPTAQELKRAELEEEWEGDTYLTADDETPKHVARRLGVLLSEVLRLNQPLYAGLT
eukprot:COSAG02_NODE_8952_length_2384_cov_1.392998_1_plen_256_part_10